MRRSMTSILCLIASLSAASTGRGQVDMVNGWLPSGFVGSTVIPAQFAGEERLAIGSEPEEVPPLVAQAPTAPTPAEPPTTPAPTANRPAPTAPRTTPSSSSPATPPSNALASNNAQRSSSTRLARSPQMFGDLFFPGSFASLAFPELGRFIDVPLFPNGGGGPLQIGENNSICPTDRFYYTFRHYANAATTTITSFPFTGQTPVVETQSHDLRIHTLGWEKAMLRNRASMEVRLPISERMDHIAQAPFVDASYEVQAVGNLSIVTKWLVMNRAKTAAAIGLGMQLPTGGDTRISVVDDNVLLRNEAFTLVPYLGILRKPTDKFSYQVFNQLSIATNGNPLIVTIPRFNVFDQLGVVTPPTFWQTSVSGNYWLFHNPDNRIITGMSLLTELHFLNTLSSVESYTAEAAAGEVVLDVPDGSGIHMLNLTAGIHTVIGRDSNFRLAAGVPISSDRAFDSEILVQWNRFY